MCCLCVSVCALYRICRLCWVGARFWPAVFRVCVVSPRNFPQYHCIGRPTQSHRPIKRISIIDVFVVVHSRVIQNIHAVSSHAAAFRAYVCVCVRVCLIFSFCPVFLSYCWQYTRHKENRTPSECDYLCGLNVHKHRRNDNDNNIIRHYINCDEFGG